MKSTSHLKGALLAASAIAFAVPSAAVAQEVAEKANEVAEQAQEVEQQAETLANDTAGGQYVAREEEEDGFDWGWLGLLGLLGLMGLRKKDDDRDIRVDARHNTRT